MLRRPPLVLGRPLARAIGGGTRVDVEVDGEVVFFESTDHDLVPTPEAVVSAFLLPAAARRRRLVVDAPLDGVWRAGQRPWAGVVRSWWGYRAKPLRCRGTSTAGRARGKETALCFSGGVDSFYACLSGATTPSALVYVQGFDRPLADESLLPRIRMMLDDVAAACGAEPIIVRTNLREHPVFASSNWERTHGGALACVGHLLDPSIGHLLIAASFAGDDAPPWGSHAWLDPLLGSSALEIVHAGSDLRRAEKLERLAHEPLLQQHLRVCWESTGATYNCSRCDKCLATMLVLRETGTLGSHSAFDPPPDFAAALDRLPGTIYRKTVRALASDTADPTLRRALLDLDQRSGEHPAYDRVPR